MRRPRNARLRDVNRLRHGDRPGSSPATSDLGVANTANALAAPSDYVAVTFNAAAGTPYTIWLRLKAWSDSKFNDSLWIQFLDAQANGSAVYPMNTTSALLVNLAGAGGPSPGA